MTQLILIDIFRTGRLRGTIRKIKEKYLLREKYYYSCSLNSLPKPQHFSLIPASQRMLEQMYNQHRDEMPRTKYELLIQRLGSETEQCLLIIENKTICGYCHIAYADHFNAWSNLWVNLAPSQVYLFDDYIFDPFRGRGLHKFSIAGRKQLAKERGYTSALTIIDKSNIPSHRAYISQGFRRVKLLWHLPLLKKNILRPL